MITGIGTPISHNRQERMQALALPRSNNGPRGATVPPGPRFHLERAGLRPFGIAPIATARPILDASEATAPGGSMKNRFWRVCLALCLLMCARAAAAPPQGDQQPLTRSRAVISELAKIPAGAEKVYVGFYPTAIYDLNVQSSTYYFLGYVWLRWKGTIDPTASLEFTNAVEHWGLTKKVFNNPPERLPDGSLYQIMLVQGRFYQNFRLHDFPLDRQTLSITIEDGNRGVDELVYVPDKSDIGYAARMRIHGWDILGWRTRQTLQDYASNFGETGSGARSKYAGLRFDLVIRRAPNFFLWKLLLPLVIVLCANWLVLLLRPDLVDVRTALAATSLLTLVFLQKAYSDSLPSVGSLMLMDKIYIMAYLVVLCTLAQVVMTAAWMKEAPSEALERRITRIDKRLMITEALSFVAVVGILVLTLQGPS